MYKMRRKIHLDLKLENGGGGGDRETKSGRRNLIKSSKDLSER